MHIYIYIEREREREICDPSSGALIRSAHCSSSLGRLRANASRLRWSHSPLTQNITTEQQS